jgi:hypothetical protein
MKQSFPILIYPARLGPSLPCLTLQSTGCVTPSILAETPIDSILSDGNGAVRRVRNVAVPVDEARRVNVNIRSVVDADR